MGDFNDMMFEHEKKGGRPQPRVFLEGFRDTLSSCGLVDIGYTGCEFTWERSRGSPGWIQERLDRGLATQVWRNMFPRAEIKVLEVSTSDHLPLFLELNKLVYVPKVRKFKFENMWIREDQCRKVVQDSWEQVVGKDVIDKLEFCCIKLDEWGGGKQRKCVCKYSGIEAR